MEFHIYRDGSGRVVKDASKQNTLYFILASKQLFSTPPKQIYRGSSEASPHIASIKKNGRRKSQHVITMGPGKETIIINPPGWFSSKSKFFVAGKEFVWKSDKELVEAVSGITVASFKRKRFSISKKGVLTVTPAGMQMIDAVVVTAITVQYYWEAKRA